MVEIFAPLLLLLPLAAALANGLNAFLGDKWFAWQTVQRLTVGAAGLAFVCALVMFIGALLNPTPKTLVLYEWLKSDGIVIEVALLIDTLSALMAVVVTGFGFVIGRFSINYMHREQGFTRYFAAYALFLFSMLLLVLSNNFVLLFVGWEAVGVCSYLLIGQYLDRKSAARASTEAFVANRVGDMGFIIAILMMIDVFGTVRYTEVFAKLSTAEPQILTAIALCLLLGAVGKSAQLPLGSWLAKAMEGPTPSSALIHAATMVTAGVYLIVRSHELYNAAPHALHVVALVGALTALYGAMVGQTVSDIKGLLATSTTTQLGLMFLACGLGAYTVAMFHLVAHAFYKSYLFLTAPSILHHLHGRLDPSAKETHQEIPSLYNIAALLTGAMVVVPVLIGLNDSASHVGGWSVSAWVLLSGAILSVATAAHYAFVLTRRAFVDDGHSSSHEVHPHSHGEHGCNHDHDHAYEAAGSANASAPGLPLGPVLWPLGLVTTAAVLGLMLEMLPGGLDNSWFRQLLAPVIASSTSGTEAAQSLRVVLSLVLVAMVVYAWFTAVFLTRYRAESALGGLAKQRQFYVASVNRFWIDAFIKRFVVEPALSLGRLFDRADEGVVDRIVWMPVVVSKGIGRLIAWLDIQGIGAAERGPKALLQHLSSVVALVESLVVGGFENGLRRSLNQFGRFGAAVEGVIAKPVIAVVLIAFVTILALLGVR